MASSSNNLFEVFNYFGISFLNYSHFFFYNASSQSELSFLPSCLLPLDTSHPC